MKTTPVNEQRERRAGDLRDRAETAQDHARALRGLAEMIRGVAAPVQRWQPVWDDVATRMERKADEYVGIANSCLAHVEVMDRAVAAHSEWIPKRVTSGE